jgi:GTP-binding protein
MNIISTEFIKSSTEVQKCPGTEFPEFAFIGRSNVGKSSLINMLLNKKGLAKTSGRPGKTQTINHFLINKEKRPWFLVDLPGYGYAKVAKSSRKEWTKFISDYLRKRENLYCTFVLVDSRHEPLEIDVDFMVQMGEWKLPYVIVFTKADKMKPGGLERNVDLYKKELLQYYNELPQMFVTSADSRLGRDELLAFIKQVKESQ